VYDLEELPENNVNKHNIMNKYVLFNKIKGINTPVKSDILFALLDGEFHSETELIRLVKRSGTFYMGAVTLGTMVNSLNHLLKSNYVEKQYLNGEMHYKISDNYVGLTRAAYNNWQQKMFKY
jgi:hypothetical protein